MPDAALLATERQFSNLLTAAAGRADVRLHLFALRDVPRSPEARAALERTYRDAASLAASRIDALIVTGAEPLAAELALEPYWPALTELIDWADANTVSTIFSCLAAHVGVQHFDRIVRQPLPEQMLRDLHLRYGGAPAPRLGIRATRCARPIRAATD